MESIKKGITRYLAFVTAVLIVTILTASFFNMFESEKCRSRGDAYAAFYQIDRRAAEGMGDIAYVVSMTMPDEDAVIYAIDKESNTVTGAANSADVGVEGNEIGFGKELLLSPPQAATLSIKGSRSYCIFNETGGTALVYVIPEGVFFGRIIKNSVMVLIIAVLGAILLIALVIRYINRHIISSINDINKVLTEITGGDFDRLVRVHGNSEFREMSTHINEMVRILLGNTDKISYILNKTDMDICVYEYDMRKKRVRFTENLPAVLVLSISETRRLESDCRRFRDLIGKLRKNPLSEEEGIYILPGNEERFLKLDEVVKGNDVFGIIVDVTKEISALRRVESEMDVDHLTGLLNRRGCYKRLDELFASEKELGHGALIMLDADDLKVINDNCGHDKGDIYLKTLADAVGDFGGEKSVAARVGGDEFVILLYGCKSEEEVNAQIDRLNQLGRSLTAHLDELVDVHVRFSYGYSMIDGKTGYEELLKRADEMMYENKRSRKNT